MKVLRLEGVADSRTVGQHPCPGNAAVAASRAEVGSGTRMQAAGLTKSWLRNKQDFPRKLLSFDWEVPEVKLAEVVATPLLAAQQQDQYLDRSRQPLVCEWDQLYK